MSLRRTILPLLALAALLPASPARAQDGNATPAPGILTPDLPRPKIGLVLSGGGARGLAHIGVIKWLEENRIPIDYVAGTSMGGLVGGAYATGMDAAEIEQLIRDINWTKVLRGAPSYYELNFRRREDQQDLPTDLEFGLRNGFSLPAAINPGHEVGLILDRMALPYSTVGSFDDLPTPFRCVAVDIMGGREIVMGDGSLAHALRSTMAIPGVFAPIKRDGMVLVDGGMLNNLPVDVVMQMGADIVIAVDVGNDEPSESDLDSVFGIADRAISVVLRVNVERNARLARHLIQPDLTTVRTLDFASPESIIEMGYEEIDTVHGEMRYLALDAPEWQAHLGQRRQRSRTREIRPKFIQVSGEAEDGDPLVQASLEGFKGEPIDEDRLADTLTSFTGWGPYDKASYQGTVEGGEEGLEVDLHRKSYGPPFLKPIFKINAGQEGDMTFEIAARATFYDFGRWRNNELRLDGSVGRTNLVGAELYQFLGGSGWFVAPRGFAQYQTQFLFNHGQRLADYGMINIGFGGDIGYNTGRSGELRFGAGYGWQKANIRSGSPLLPTVQGQASSVRGQWRFDRRNSELVNTRGVAFSTRAAYHIDGPGSSGAPTQFDGALDGAFPLTRRWSAQYRAAAGGTFRGEAGPFQQFTLGGPSRVGALGFEERRGNHLLYASTGVLRLLKENPGGLVERVFAGAWYEGGDAFDDDPHWVHSGSVGFTGETKIGLFYVGGSFGAGNVRFYLSLGKFF